MIGLCLIGLMINKSCEVIVFDNIWKRRIKYLVNIVGFDINRNFINQDLSINKPFEYLKEKNFDYIVNLVDIVAGIGYVFGIEGIIFEINNKIISMWLDMLLS